MERPVRSAISRTASMTARWSSCSPWEKFSRTTFTPASMSCCRVPGSREAGPIVATILVRRIAREYSRPR